VTNTLNNRLRLGKLCLKKSEKVIFPVIFAQFITSICNCYISPCLRHASRSETYCNIKADSEYGRVEHLGNVMLQALYGIKLTLTTISTTSVTIIYHKACADSALSKCLYHNPCRCERLPSSILSPHCEHCRGHHIVPIQHLETDLLCLFPGHSQSFLGYLSGEEMTIISTK
jgi:hypothetical protein